VIDADPIAVTVRAVEGVIDADPIAVTVRAVMAARLLPGCLGARQA
jgi:hypothetical protein